jgi:hypothetical protein
MRSRRNKQSGKVETFTKNDKIRWNIVKAELIKLPMMVKSLQRNIEEALKEFRLTGSSSKLNHLQQLTFNISSK